MLPFQHPGSIGVFDSGIGGLTVANAISTLLPRESLLYVADNARAPYGPRPAAEIRAFSFAITRALLRAGAKLIVVACNTATSVAIDELRATWPDVLFVGTEPAVKPAAAGRAVLVMATEATLASRRYRELRARYLADRRVWENPCRGLVPLIEAGDSSTRGFLRDVLAEPLAGGVDTIVLGCTHYPLIGEQIRELAGDGVTVIDPAGGAAAQVQRLLTRHGLTADSGNGPPAHRFHCSRALAPLQRTLYALPRLNAHRRWLAPAPVL